MKKAVVTGGAGFVGSHLCRSLLDDGYEVIAIDNLITGTTDNIADLQTRDRFGFLLHDCRLPLPIYGDVSHVFHLASLASPVAYYAHPIQTLEVGSQGTMNALTLARNNNARFLLASTSEVYGDPAVNPQPESYWGNVSPIGPRSVYDESKRYAEALTMAFYREFGVATRIARIFNTYGPNMAIADGRALPNFITQALANEPVTVYGNGSQTRSFCYVSDTVRGLRALMDSDEHMPVNIGNPDERTLRDTAEAVVRVTGCDSEIVQRDLPEDDPKLRQPDITRARQLLEWEPLVDFDTGLRSTVTWFMHQIAMDPSAHVVANIRAIHDATSV